MGDAPNGEAQSSRLNCLSAHPVVPWTARTHHWLSVDSSLVFLYVFFFPIHKNIL